MRTSIPPKYTWSDAQLTDAVKASACWRDVVRALGLTTTSEGVMRRVRRHTALLGLDVSHFKGTRTWDDAQLKRAVAEGHSWDDVFTSLGLRTPRKDTRARITGHAIRLGLDLRHLNANKRRNSRYRPVGVLTQCGCATPRCPLPPHGLRFAGLRFPCLSSRPSMISWFNQMMESTGCKSKRRRRKAAGNGWIVTVSRRPYSVGNLRRACLMILMLSTTSSSWMATTTCT